MIKHVNDVVGNTSGVVSVTSGLATAANAASDGGVLPFLNENAGAIGAIVTCATFAVFLLSKSISIYIDVREHRRRMIEPEQGTKGLQRAET